MTLEGAKKCLISDTSLRKRVTNFSMCCMNYVKIFEIEEIKEKTVCKFIPNKQNIHESLIKHHCFSLAECLPFFQHEFILPTSREGFWPEYLPSCYDPFLMTH